MQQVLFQEEDITQKQPVRNKTQSRQIKLVNQGQCLAALKVGLGFVFLSSSSSGYSDGHSYFVLDHGLGSTKQPIWRFSPRQSTGHGPFEN